MKMKKQIVNNKIGLSREIIRQNWGLNLREKRLLMLAVSKIDYSQSSDLNRDKEWDADRIGDDQVVVTAAEYKQMMGSATSVNNVMRDLASAVKSLAKKSLTLKVDNKHIKTINYTSAVDYLPQEKIVIITFNPLFWPYLINLCTYVGYKLNDVKNLSEGSWRLFEVLLSYPPTIAKIDVDDIKFALNVENKTTSDFLKRNIRPALIEINKHTKIKVNMMTKKKGRSITSLIFKRS